MAKISIDEVKQRLEQQFALKVRKIRRAPSVVTEENHQQEEAIEFVESVNDNLFIFKKDDSFILSPADDTLDPVIGEFDEIPENNEMPPCMKDWFETYSQEINDFQREESEMTSAAMTSANNSIEMVDLGLSVNWGNMNIGATVPEESGEFYAWGETNTKSVYNWDTYEYMEKIPETYVNIGSDIAKTEYDQAYTFSNTMCLPNEEQWKELQSKCKFVQKTMDGVVGYDVTGPSGNKIFLPFSGCKYDGGSHDVNKLCYYHSSNAGPQPSQTLAKKVGKSSINTIANIKRRTGCVIRPIATDVISEKTLGIKFVDMGLSVKWANMNLGATKETESGDFYAWGDPEANKKDYTWETYKYYIPESTKVKDIGNNISKEYNYDKARLTDDSMCIPTEEQWKELISKCTLTETTLNNVKGYDVVGPSGNKIFLPFTGYMLEKLSSAGSLAYYTSGTVYQTTDNEYCKSCLFKTGKSSTIEKTRKRTGLPIRPVTVQENSVKKTVQPLVPYKWGQGAPYNCLLPTDPVKEKTVVTGCNSTALAQVMAYLGLVGLDGEKFKRGSTKIPAYTSRKGTKYQLLIPSLDSITVFDYKEIDLIKKSDFKTEEAKNAVGTLLKYIGYSFKSNYSYDGTSASPSVVASSMKSHFRLGSNIKLITASGLGIAQFKDKIYDNLIQGLPVIMSGWNSKGGGGHTFVCDGYNATTDKYHFNWGWDGYYNGWFNITLLKPTSEDDFSYNKKAIINIKPDYELGDTNNDNVINITDVMNLIQAIIDKKTDKKYDINSDGKVTEEDASILIDYILGKVKL